MKQEKYAEAVGAYSTALTEHRNADTLQALQKVTHSLSPSSPFLFFLVNVIVEF